MHLFWCHFYTFLLYFIKRYSDLQQVVFQCKKYSKSTAGNGTQRKTVIFTADIFTVQMKSVRGILRIQYHNSRDLNFSISHPWCACSISRGLFNYFALEFPLFSEPPHEILQGHSKPAKSEESLFVPFLLGKILWFYKNLAFEQPLF